VILAVDVAVEVVVEIAGVCDLYRQFWQDRDVLIVFGWRIMSFGQAVSSVFSKYVTFSGRARRSEYWYWVLFAFLLGVVAAILDAVFKSYAYNSNGVKFGWVSVVVGALLLLPSIAVTMRRLHDTGRSGWWWLVSALCGIGAIIVFFFCLGDSKPGANQYGPNPKGQ